MHQKKVRRYRSNTFSFFVEEKRFVIFPFIVLKWGNIIGLIVLALVFRLHSQPNLCMQEKRDKN